MKSMYWVTIPGGDVVESVGPFLDAWSANGSHLLGHKVAVCRRVSTGAHLGTRRLDRLRPATESEVARARERGKASR